MRNNYGRISLDGFLLNSVIEKIEKRRLLEQSEILAIETLVVKEFEDLKEFLSEEEFNIAVKEEVKERFKLYNNTI